MAGIKGMKWSKRPTMTADQMDQLRQLISGRKIIKALENSIFGAEEMQPHQVSAALGLLRKVLPDLAATEHTFNANVSILVGLESLESKLFRELTLRATSPQLALVDSGRTSIADSSVGVLGETRSITADGVFERDENLLAGEGR
jgi:hypothetical protein